MSDQRLVWFIGFGAIVLVGLVLAVLLGAARIGLAIFRDWRQSREPKKSMVVDGLGTLTFDARSSLWFGMDREVSITIAGNGEGPDGRLVAAYREIRRELAGLQSAALSYLTEREEKAKAADFSLCGIDLLWLEKKDCFVLEFYLEGDSDGVWRWSLRVGSRCSRGGMIRFLRSPALFPNQFALFKKVTK